MFRLDIESEEKYEQQIKLSKLYLTNSIGCIKEYKTSYLLNSELLNTISCFLSFTEIHNIALTSGENYNYIYKNKNGVILINNLLITSNNPLITSNNPLINKNFFVTNLTINIKNISNKQINKILLLHNQNYLESVNFSGCCKITHKGIKALSNFPNIRSINLSKCNRIDNGIFDILCKLNKLESLNLSYCNRITNELFNHKITYDIFNNAIINKLSNNIKQLYLCHCYNINNNGSILSCLKELEFKFLEVLDVRYTTDDFDENNNIYYFEMLTILTYLYGMFNWQVFHSLQNKY